MSDSRFYIGLLTAELVLAVGAAASVLLVTAPYGRHLRQGFGPTLPARWAWIVMESPAVLVFAAAFFSGRHAGEAAALVLLGLWLSHYLHRSFVYPFQMRTARPVPLLVALLGFSFNVLNGYINGRWISHFGEYPDGWLSSGRFVFGSALFVAGWSINRWADGVLRRLRKPGESGYSIPRGGLYELISCPNYGSELLQWLGFAVAAWSPAALAFTLFTAANLVPRAISHHRWYRDTFPAYPLARKAIVPYVL